MAHSARSGGVGPRHADRRRSGAVGRARHRVPRRSGAGAACFGPRGGLRRTRIARRPVGFAETRESQESRAIHADRPPGTAHRQCGEGRWRGSLRHRCPAARTPVCQHQNVSDVGRQGCAYRRGGRACPTRRSQGDCTGAGAGKFAPARPNVGRSGSHRRHNIPCDAGAAEDRDRLGPRCRSRPLEPRSHG